MYTNLYNIYYRMPALEKVEMLVELEEMAEELVNSGLLRIEAEPRQNFTRYSQPTRSINIEFSKRELFEEHLLPQTKSILERSLRDAGEFTNLEQKIDKEIEKLRNNLKKHVEVDLDLELKVARILVQSAHPVVIKLIILEKVQVFISFGHSIGEVMDIASWKVAGSNSGMQSTDGKNVAVYVSCGGDPLLFEEMKLEKEKKKEPDLDQEEQEVLFGDGLPALARMMGIAGQEIGHYSDIIYDKNGRQIGRFSANFSGTRANETVNLSRLTDMNNIQILWGKLIDIGLTKLIDRENEVKLFRRFNVKSLGFLIKILIMKMEKKRFIYLAQKLDFSPIKDFINKDYTGSRLQAMLGDMMFNLAPVADVYSNADKNIETAIACIEALARVPQQVNKWGHGVTRYLWRNLYKFYYYKVIPGCIVSYEQMSGETFTMYPHKMRHYNWKEKIIIRLNQYIEKRKKRKRKS